MKVSAVYQVLAIVSNISNGLMGKNTHQILTRMTSLPNLIIIVEVIPVNIIAPFHASNLLIREDLIKNLKTLQNSLKIQDFLRI